MSAQVVEIARALPRRSAYVVTAEEMEALYGAGPLAFMVYMWLRSWMDFRSGVVGFTRALSREMLCTYCETHTPRGQGVQMEKPTLKQLRGALDALIRRGLLRRRDTELLVFSMPLARTENVRPLQTGPSEGREQGRENSSSGAGFEGEQGRPFSANRADNRVSGAYPSAAAFPSSTVAARAESADAAAWSNEATKPTPSEHEMSAIEIRVQRLAALLEKHSICIRNGQGAFIESWAARGITEKALTEVIAKAIQIRARDGSTEPIWIGLINTLLADFKPPRRSKAVERQPAGDPDWRNHPTSIDRKARALRMGRKVVEEGGVRRLEFDAELVARIEAELKQRGGDHGSGA